MRNLVRHRRVHVHPDRRQVVTADEETDLRISDYELMMRDIRDGCLDGLFIITVFALFVWGCWVFV